MDLREALSKILTEWQTAKRESFGGHELANFVRSGFPEIVRNFISDHEETLIVKGSPGQGNWAEVPWLSVLHPKITNSTTHGVYPVYLFRADSSGVYLTLGQGTTDPIHDLGSRKAWEFLKSRAKRIQLDIPALKSWSTSETDLRASSPLGKSYEKPNIGYMFYDADSLPSHEKLVEDLHSILGIYDQVVRQWSHLGSFVPEDKKENEMLSHSDNEVLKNLWKWVKIFDEDLVGQMTVADDLPLRSICALSSKPFLLFTGLSGSGKTKLALAFSTWICGSKAQINLIAVGADWTSNENLLGYPDALNPGQYRKPDNGVLDLILNAQRDSEHPYFLILDEMNLSHVERYFADFLSAMESGEPIHLHEDTGADWNGVPAKLNIPDNLFVIGTVNIDETTYMFSPKVLDRANVIEFRVDPHEMEAFLENPVKPDLEKIACHGAAYAKSFVAAARRKDVPLDDVLKTEIRSVLMSFFNPLQEAGAEFGYRTAHEICRFVYFHKELSGDDWSFESAMDAAVMQKLLPKLHGSKKKLGPVLETLMRLCLKTPPIKDDPLKEEHMETANVRYPASLEKLKRMEKRLQQHGFTSFAEA